MKDVILTSELVEWVNQSIQYLKRQRENIDGQIQGLLSVRRAFTDEMQVNKDE